MVDDNVMKNVLSLTARVTSIWSKVNPITYLVKIMVGLHTVFQVYNIQGYLTLLTTIACNVLHIMRLTAHKDN